MPEEIKIFKKGDQTFDVPVSELDSFMSEVPDAVEVNVYESDGKTFDVPTNELDEFMKQVPDAKLKAGSKKKVEPLDSGPGRDSFDLGSTPESLSQDEETIPSSVGQSFLDGEPEKDPILIRAAEKSPWLAAPINFLNGAVHGTSNHILKSLDGAQKLFYRGVGNLMMASPAPGAKAAGAKLLVEQDKTKTWWKQLDESVEKFADDKLPEPDKSNLASRLLYTAGDLAPFMATLAITPNPSVIGVGMKLPINFGTIAAMGEYSESDDVGKMMKAGLIGAGDGLAIHAVGWGAGEAGAVISRQLGNKFPSLAELAGTTGAATMMFGGGMAHDVAKQVSEGATDIDWQRATDAGFTFFAFGLPGILNAAVSTFKQAPKASIAMARQIDTDVNGVRNEAVKMEREAMAEADPVIKTAKMVDASLMHKMADLKFTDMFFGKNKEESLKWVDKVEMSDADKQILRDKIEEADLYQQQVEQTKDLQKAEETIKKAEEKKAEAAKEKAPVAEKVPAREAVLTEKRPATKGMKKILKAGEETYTMDIEKDGNRIGEVSVEESPDSWSVKRVDVDPAEQRKGVATEAYKDLNKQAEQEGKVLRSDRPDKINEESRPLWDKLVEQGDAVKMDDGSYVMKNKYTDEYLKPKEEKVAAGEAKKPEPEKKAPVITAETSEKYADMSVTPEGEFVFFHKSGEKRDVIDPAKSGTRKDTFTSVEEKSAAESVGGVSYYYTDTSKQEPGAGKVEHRIKVPKEKVYDADADPLGFGQEAKARYEKKFPGKGWSNNHRVFWITKLAAEKGYDITVADWGGRTRAHSVKKMTPEEGVEFTEARKEGYKRQEPVIAETVYRNVLDKINAHRNKSSNFDDLYHAKTQYFKEGSELYQNKKAITDLVEKSDLPEGLKKEYMDALSAKDVPGVSVKPPVEGEPPAKVPPEPPKPPEKPVELPEGEKGKPERDVMDVMKDIKKERTVEMAKRKKSLRMNWRYLFVDQQEPFKVAALKAAKKAGLGDKAARKLVDRKNTEKGAKARSAMEFSEDLKEITGGIRGFGAKEMELISDYNDMRRTNELWKSREAFGKSELMMEGGVSQKQADAFLTNVRKKDPSVLKQYGIKDYDFKKIKEASDKFNEKYRDILDELKSEGIISQEAYDAITFEHPYYSPRKFIRSMDKIDSGGSMSGIEALKGGSEAAKIVDAPALYYEALARKNNLVARTRTMRAMEQFIKEVNPKFMRQAEYDPKFVEKLSKAEEGDPWIEPTFKDTPKGMENVDYIDANGKKQRFFMDADVHKYFDIEPFGDLSRKIMNYAGWISGTKILKAAATGYNPEFMVKNIPIDMMHILNTTDVYSGALPIAHAQMMADMARVAKDVTLRKGAYKDFMKEGGGMEMLTGEGRLRTGVSRMKLHKGIQALEAIEGLASWPGKSSELITRLALRHRHLENAKRDFLKDQGREPTAKEVKEMQLDATAYSRNYLDFEQGGRLVKMADSVIPYLNAGFQVTRGSLRAAGKNPALYGAKVAQIATVAGAITAWNMGLFSKDPEEGEAMKNAYLNDVSDEVKARSFVLMTPFKYEDARGTEKYLYVKFPKDNAQELITGVAETRVLREIMGEDAPKYLSARRLKELQVMSESVTNVSQLPPAVRGALGYKLNKDFFYGGELWMGYDFGKDKSLEYKRDTPERYKAVGKIPMPGGHKLSPIRSHYMAKQFFTESNVIATGIGEMMDRAVSGFSEELKTEYTPGQIEKIKNAPFARRFLKSTYPGASKQGSDTHQQDYNKIKQEHNLGLQKLIDKEASPDEVFNWLGSIIEGSEGDITSIKEYERLSRRYKEEVIMPSMNSWVESLKHVDAIPRAQDLFDQWVHMDDDTRDHLLESAAVAGVLSETTIIKLTELMDEYDSEMKGVGPGEGKKPKEKKD